MVGACVSTWGGNDMPKLAGVGVLLLLLALLAAACDPGVEEAAPDEAATDPEAEAPEPDEADLE